jgi:hypothetical protein
MKNHTRISLLGVSSKPQKVCMSDLTDLTGQTSQQIFRSRHRRMRVGCLINEKACPIRFVPKRMASYRFRSTLFPVIIVSWQSRLMVDIPSPRVSPAWKRKGKSTPSESHLDLKASSGSK